MLSQQSKIFDGWRLVFFLFIIAVITRLPSLFVGFYNPDETCYATIAQRMLEGKYLYIDILDHKPPLIYLIYAVFAFIGGAKTIYVAHAGSIVVISVTAFVLARIVSLFKDDKRISVLAAILYVVGTCLGKPNDVAAANSEFFFNLPLALHIFFVSKSLKNDGSTFGNIVLSGLFAGVAALIKPHGALVPIATLLFLVWNRNFRSSFYLLTAFLFLPLLTALHLYFTNRFGEAWYWGFTVNSLYMKGHQEGLDLFLRFIKQTAYMLFLEESAYWLPLIACLIFRKRLGSLLGQNGNIVWWWLIASAIAVFPGARFFGHYYLQMLPPLSILAAICIFKIMDFTAQKKLFASVLFVLIVIPFIYSWIWALPIDSFRKNIESSENRNLIEFMKKNSGPQEKIEVWGRFNGIPFLAMRENGSRFLNKNLLSGSFRSKELVQMPQKHWDLFFADMNRNRPEWFIDHSPVDMKEAPLEMFPVLSDYIGDNYSKVSVIDGSIVYFRKK